MAPPPTSSLDLSKVHDAEAGVKKLLLRLYWCNGQRRGRFAYRAAGNFAARYSVKVGNSIW
jgi:hypothetical protein